MSFEHTTKQQNKQKEKTMNINKIKQSRFGRIVCRMFGEERGAVMMEYVIVAVLIAAAVAVGAWYFGRSVNNEFRVASHGVTGDDISAQEAQDNAQKNVSAQDAAAKGAQKNYIQTADEDAADL